MIPLEAGGMLKLFVVRKRYLLPAHFQRAVSELAKNSNSTRVLNLDDMCQIGNIGGAGVTDSSARLISFR